MALDTDVRNPDEHLQVEFYTHSREPYVDQPFVRITVPGDKTNVVDRPVREEDRQRFPRQWLYFNMKNDGSDVIGTPLANWEKERPGDVNQNQIAELSILKFMTVEQVAMATDAQVQRIGMGATGLREKARLFLREQNQSASMGELEATKKQLAELQAQVAELLQKRGPGAPPKGH